MEREIRERWEEGEVRSREHISLRGWEWKEALGL